MRNLIRCLGIAWSAFLVFSISSAAVQPVQIPTNAVRGVVVRADNAEPIAGAEVFLKGKSADPRFGRTSITSVETGSDGRFLFDRLSSGSYEVAATAEGYPVQSAASPLTLNGKMPFPTSESNWPLRP